MLAMSAKCFRPPAELSVECEAPMSIGNDFVFGPAKENQKIKQTRRRDHRRDLWGLGIEAPHAPYSQFCTVWLLTFWRLAAARRNNKYSGMKTAAPERETKTIPERNRFERRTRMVLPTQNTRALPGEKRSRRSSGNQS